MNQHMLGNMGGRTWAGPDRRNAPNPPQCIAVGIPTETELSTKVHSVATLSDNWARL